MLTRKTSSLAYLRISSSLKSSSNSSSFRSGNKSNVSSSSIGSSGDRYKDKNNSSINKTSTLQALPAKPQPIASISAVPKCEEKEAVSFFANLNLHNTPLLANKPNIESIDSSTELMSMTQANGLLCKTP
uniref:Uncharacterized protein n=1 Tax=Lygus hesperus TaxID=30085 RepID=A0A0A9YQ33_LYGHE